jgi:hypothetical protein
VNKVEQIIRKPVDPWPGQAQVLGGPHDGKWIEISGSCWIYPVLQKPISWLDYSATPSIEDITVTAIQCNYERYIWYEYFFYLWFFVPIEIFIRTFAIDPSLKDEM